MDFVSASIYGAIQGLTEFLPVSSSGHLALLPPILGIPDPGVSFDLAMHLGTSLAVLGYYRREMLGMVRGLLSERRGPQGVRARNLLLAMMGTFVVALLFRKFAETHARTPVVIAINLMVFGILMWAADRWGRSSPERVFEEPQWKRSILVGIAQGLAIFPGVSRSGATLAAQAARCEEEPVSIRQALADRTCTS